MNKEQRNLVKFIMAMNDDQFELWAIQATVEEVEEAINAIRSAREEADKSIKYLEEEDLQNCHDARKVLSPFTLNGLK